MLMVITVMLTQGEGAFPVISKALQYGGNLTIPHLTKDDQGSYECVASNPVTNVITSSLLIIECMPISITNSPIITQASDGALFSRDQDIPLDIFPTRTIPFPFLHGLGYSSLPPPLSANLQYEAIFR